MGIQRSVSVNGRLQALEDTISAQMVTMQGFDLYLRSVEQMLVDKKLVTSEELDAIRQVVIKEYLAAKLKKTNIIVPK